MRRLIRLLMFIFVFSSCSIHGNDIEKMILHGYYLMDGMQYEKAFQVFDQCVKIDSLNVSALDGRGNSLIDLGKKDEGFFDLKKAYSIDSNNVTVNNDLGRYYCLIDNLSLAKHFYQKAILNDSLSKIPYSNLGVIAVLEGKFDSAFIYHDKAIDIDSLFAASFINRAIAFQAVGNYNLALLDFNKAVNLSDFPKVIYASHKSRGALYKDMKDYEKAIDDFTITIEINPNDIGLYHLRGLTYTSIKKYKLAIEDFKKAKNLGHPTAETMIGECEYLLKTGT